VVWAGPRGLGDGSPPEAEAKFEISMQFLTFSCTKFTVRNCVPGKPMAIQMNTSL